MLVREALKAALAYGSVNRGKPLCWFSCRAQVNSGDVYLLFYVRRGKFGAASDTAHGPTAEAAEAAEASAGASAEDA